MHGKGGVNGNGHVSGHTYLRRYVNEEVSDNKILRIPFPFTVENRNPRLLGILGIHQWHVPSSRCLTGNPVMLYTSSSTL